MQHRRRVPVILSDVLVHFVSNVAEKIKRVIGNIISLG
jgi:hypothetical protein